jgi:hypothetical protein
VRSGRKSVRRRLFAVGVIGAVTLVASSLTGSAHAATRPAAVGTNCTGGFVQDPAVWLTLTNNTFLTLTRASFHLDHGSWHDLPPASIGIGQFGCWSSHASGLFTGTEGTATYNTEAGDVTVHWDAPFIGRNSYPCTVPAGYKCTLQPGTGDGDDAFPQLQIDFNF